jgi:transposase
METHANFFTTALGVPEPWFVNRIEFSSDQKRLDIDLDFRQESAFACPMCHQTIGRACTTQLQTWRHLNFFQHEAYLHARVPWVECPNGCGVHPIEVP